MNAATMRAMREMAETVSSDGRWKVMVGDRVKVWGVTKERAEDDARWWKDARVERM